METDGGTKRRHRVGLDCLSNLLLLSERVLLTSSYYGTRSKLFQPAVCLVVVALVLAAAVRARAAAAPDLVAVVLVPAVVDLAAAVADPVREEVGLDPVVAVQVLVVVALDALEAGVRRHALPYPQFVLGR
jgi:hypothetical protein